MLTRFDDYPIHQTPEPVAHPSTGDRNFYDRYFFDGWTDDGAVYFAAALGLYPNRRVMDAAFSVVRDGVQSCVRASRLAVAERGETRVGPIAVEVVEPLRTLRVRVDENPHGVAADLVFRRRTAAIEEPRFTFRQHGRVLMDSTRLTQFGTWDGWLAVGEPEGGAPGGLPQFFWLWAPVHFDDVCTHFDANEDADGRRWHQGGCVVPVVDAAADDAPPVEQVARAAHRIAWRAGTRRARSAEITLTPLRGEPAVVTLEPILTFQMLGLGYLHPTWAHGTWHGALAVDGERWTLADCDPLVPQFLHVQALCRATWGDRRGMGVLEQLVLGPHAPSGFASILDGAA